MRDPALPPTGARVLVVDDDPANRDVLAQELELLDLEPQTVADGHAALALLAVDPPDLVLLDVMMPGIDGFSVLAEIRGDPALRHLPVVMISALDDLASVVRAVELGADDYLTKPFEPVLLRARVHASLARKRWADQEALYLARIEGQLAEIRRERERADRLLHAILPAPAVDELKRTGRITPRRHDGVAVLFADLVGFTAWCEAHPAEEVVEQLGRLVVACEDIVAEHGLEKIKGVGDGIAVTANLLKPSVDPVGACVACGFAIMAAARSVHPDWGMRIGIDWGSVVAAVVGRSKFTYDVWGDAVNVACRLSGLGGTEALHLTERARAMLGDAVPAVSLGPVAVRGRGEMEVWRCLQPGREPHRAR